MQRIIYRISSADALCALLEQGAAASDGEELGSRALPLGEPLEEAVHAGAWVLATFEVEQACELAECNQPPTSKRPLCASARVVEHSGGALLAHFDDADWQRIERYVRARLLTRVACEPREWAEPCPPSSSRSRAQEPLAPGGVARAQATLKVVFWGSDAVCVHCLGDVASCVQVATIEELAAHGAEADALVLQGEVAGLLAALPRVRAAAPCAALVCVVPQLSPQPLRALMEAGADEVLPCAARAAEVAATLLALVRRRTPRGQLSSGVA